jgi:hypothetical protein
MTTKQVTVTAPLALQKLIKAKKVLYLTIFLNKIIYIHILPLY